MNCKMLTVVLSLSIGLVARPSGADLAGKTGSQRWGTALEGILELIGSGKLEKAQVKLADLIRDIVDHCDASKEARVALGLALAERAVLEQRLGDNEGARWSWQLALNIVPTLGNELAGTGKLAEFSAAFGAWQLPSSELCSSGVEGRPICNTETCKGFDAPKVIKRVTPQLTGSMLRGGGREALEVRVVVEADGSASSPRVLSGRWASLAYVTLAAMRQWRFEPAHVEGQAVASCFSTTFYFHR